MPRAGKSKATDVAEGPEEQEQTPEVPSHILDTSGDQEGTPNPEPDQTPNLAAAIVLMTEELRRRPDKTTKVKTKEPDVFDGSDPRKLNNFILLCNLYFKNNTNYSDDEPKVTFALSHLRGTALEYFEPTILDPDENPEWLDDWSAFAQTL